MIYQPVRPMCDPREMTACRSLQSGPPGGDADRVAPPFGQGESGPRREASPTAILHQSQSTTAMDADPSPKSKGSSGSPSRARTPPRMDCVFIRVAAMAAGDMGDNGRRGHTVIGGGRATVRGGLSTHESLVEGWYRKTIVSTGEGWDSENTEG